jgi:hypothetical protein
MAALWVAAMWYDRIEFQAEMAISSPSMGIRVSISSLAQVLSILEMWPGLQLETAVN